MPPRLSTGAALAGAAADQLALELGQAAQHREQPLVTAGVAVSGQIALMFDTNGNAIPADPTSLSYAFAGLSLAAGGAGAPIPVALAGPVSSSTWAWTPLQPILVGLAGTLTQALPNSGFLHQVGIALSSTEIFLAPSLPILLA